MDQERDSEPTERVIIIREILDLIPEPDRTKVLQILQVYQDVSDAATQLKPILEAYEAQLQQHGFEAGYLAYKLPFEIYGAVDRGELGHDSSKN